MLNRNAADRLDFQLSTDATSLTSGSWTNYDSLDFNSPNILAAVGALDGNAAGNRAAMSFLISGLNIANGASFWIRWVSFDIASADDGLAVDDFSLTPLGTPVPEPGTLAKVLWRLPKTQHRISKPLLCGLLCQTGGVGIPYIRRRSPGSKIQVSDKIDA